jgi:hypothetical protein
MNHHGDPTGLDPRSSAELSVPWDGTLDAHEWKHHAPLEVVAVVRAAITEEPTPRALRRALYRAQLASDDEFTRLVAERCQDNAYANVFGKALLRAE